MILRRRAAAAVLAVLATAGCARTVDGTLADASGGASGGGSLPSGPTSFPSSATAPSSGAPSLPATSSPAPPSPTSTSASLASLLEPIPKGFRPGRLAWDRNVTPTVAQFVKEFYDTADQASELKVLAAEKLQQVAHRVWFDTDQFADVVLLRFATTGGAQVRYRGVVAVTKTETTLTATSIGGRGAPVVFVAKKKDSDGDIGARSYALVGRYVVETFIYTKPPFDTAHNTAWLRGQIARLP